MLLVVCITPAEDYGRVDGTAVCPTHNYKNKKEQKLRSGQTCMSPRDQYMGFTTCRSKLPRQPRDKKESQEEEEEEATNDRFRQFIENVGTTE